MTADSNPNQVSNSIVEFSFEDPDNLATQMMDRIPLCGCGKANCWTVGLRSLRDQMAHLIRAIDICEHEGVLFEKLMNLSSISFALQAAVSILSVRADPSVIDESQSALYCRPAWEYNEELRIGSSRYIAALSIYTFTWQSYESASNIISDQLLLKDKPAVRARKFFSGCHTDFDEVIPKLPNAIKTVHHICNGIPILSQDTDKTTSEYELTGAAEGAEYVRLFRNYIVHGDDGSPITGNFRVTHIYANIQLLLMLIQCLIYESLAKPKSEVPTSYMDEETTYKTASSFISNLHVI